MEEEEVKKWSRNKKEPRKGVLVSCSYCHNARGTMHKLQGKWLCELCYKAAMRK